MADRRQEPDLFQQLTLNLVLHQQALADRLGLNLTDFKCLGILHRQSGITPKKLSEMTRLSGAAITIAIDRLEEAGLVKRKRDPDDRRSLTVEATAGGERKVRDLYSSLGRRILELNAGYTTEELGCVYRYLVDSTAVLAKEIERLRNQR
jgi:DNA-binding MarR family transcriptional regulator